MLKREWPDNVRELQNVVERAIVLARGSRVEIDDLPEDVRRVPATDAPGRPRTLADIEREHILHVLESAGGHRTKAAAMLGIGPATLFRKLKGYGQPVPGK